MQAFVTAVPIDSGRFGTVYKAMTQEGTMVAVKKLPLARHDVNKVDNVAMIQREYTNWAKVSGKDNIVKLLDFSIDEKENAALFISEYCENGTLQSRINTANDTKTVRHVLRDVLKGVQSCHESDVAHCDVKPSNILLYGDTWKLTDFGCSQHVTSATDGLHARKGTPMFIAPEILKSGESYGKSVDLWAVGVLAFMLLYKGIYPFEYVDNHQFIKAVIRGEVTWPENSTKAEKDFIQEFLTVDSRLRITCENALKHPFMVDPL